MRALRALTAILLAAIAAAGGSRVSVQPMIATADVCAQAGTELRRVQPLPESHTFLGSTATTSLAGSVGEAGPTHGVGKRSVRPVRSAPRLLPAGRIAAVVRDRLDFAHRLDAARLGWFSFGSTPPPPFRI